MIWFRPRNVVAVIVALAVAGTGLYLVLRPDPPDPRLEWVATADDRCAEFSVQLTSLGPPTDIADPEVVGEWVAASVAIYDALLSSLSEIPAHDADTEALAAAVAASFEQRRAATEGLADDSSPSAVRRADEQVDASFSELAELLEPWDSEVCAEPITPTSGPEMREDPGEVWLAAATSTCEEAVVRFAAADEAVAAGRTTRDEYLDTVAAYADQLADQLEGLPGEAPPGPAETWGELIAAIRDSSVAAAAGDVAATAAAGDRWIAAGKASGVGPCAAGIAANTGGDSANLFAEPVVPEPADGSGVADGVVVDADAAVVLFANSMVSGASSDAASSFGARRVISAIAPRVAFTDGSSTPAPGQVSLSPPASRVLNETFGRSGDVVGLAVTDSSGRCATARFWTEGGRPIGFEAVVAPTCTGDGARDAAPVG